MRLPAEKIREAIFNPDRDLREAAVFYFSRSYSPDPTLMPLVVQVFGQFGLDAFERFDFLDDLVQTPESVAWLIGEVERVDPDADERSNEYFTSCVGALRHADSKALKPHEATIQQMRQLDDDTKKVIADRLQIAELTPEALWSKLTEFCQRLDDAENAAKSDLELGASLADALARYPDRCADEILEILKQGEEGNGWLELFAVRMAGRLRLEAAIPYLVDLLSDFELYACDDARQALTRIASDSVVGEMAGRYATANSDLRMGIAFQLEDIHSDLSVQTCLDLLGQEEDLGIRAILIQALLMNFASEGIEVAREFVLSTPKCPESLEVRSLLLLAAKMLGMTFPEFDAWTEDSKTDREFRREWYKDNPLLGFADSSEETEDDWDEEEFGDGFRDEPLGTIVRHDQKVGRNDPCPCGSGKKFKKCCLNKRVSR